VTGSPALVPVNRREELQEGGEVNGDFNIGIFVSLAFRLQTKEVKDSRMPRVNIAEF